MVHTQEGIGVALGFLIGIVAHEYIQHRVAYALGDKTPKLMGRLTLNIKAHTDPIGTVIAPVIFVLAALFSNGIQPMFGWGKRHALNAYGLKQPTRDGVIIGLTGPVTNALVAVIAGRVATSVGLLTTAGRILFAVALVNIFLAVMEILPLPGRDGARILALFLSPAGASKLEDLAQYEALFLAIIILFPFLAAIVNGMASAACSPLIGRAAC